MSGWAMPLQQASYKGVGFDVLSVDDSLERAVMEHSYPFVNGADLEDMGLNPQTVRMQAVFYGLNFYTRYQQFLKALQNKGAAVLVHPVRGRMPNMLLVSMNAHFEADSVNYVALDLTFKEASEMQPIFVMETSLIGKIDALLLSLEAAFNAALDFWDSAMGLKAFLNFKARLLGMWGGLCAVFEAVRTQFGLDKRKYGIASSTSVRTYLSDGKSALNQLKTMVDLGIQARADLPALSFRSQFLNVVQAVENTQNIAKQVAQDEGFNRSKTVKLRGADLVELGLVLDFVSTLKLARICATILEEQGDDLLISELELINQTVRSHCLSLVNQLRAQQQSTQAIEKGEQTQKLYETCEQAINQVREIAHQFTTMVLVVINQKPPLMVRQVAEGGTIHKIAHQFYGDYSRADELLRLNPQINQPNFIESGAWLNGYSV